MIHPLNSFESIEASILAAKRGGFFQGDSAEGLARWIHDVHRSHAAARRGALNARMTKRNRTLNRRNF